MGKEFKDRLKELMEYFDIKKQAEFAEKTNNPKPTVSQWLKGDRKARQDTLSDIAEIFGVNEAWLMGYDVPMFPQKESEGNGVSNIYPIELKKFPMLGEIACGEPRYANEDRESYVLAGSDIKADCCLTAKGDSMTGARINDGDIVFIRRQDMVENGEIAAVVVNNDSEATLKRFYYYPEDSLLILKPENPLFSDQIYRGEQLNEVHIIGKAIAFQSDVI